MRYCYFTEAEQMAYPICFLVPSIKKDDVRKAYIDAQDLDPAEVLVLDLHYAEDTKKTPMAEMKRWIVEELAPLLRSTQCGYVLVADSEYFKALTGAVKVDAHLGYVMDSTFGPWKVSYVPNYRSIFYDPDRVKGKIYQAVKAVKDHRAGTYRPPGDGIVHFAEYPMTVDRIEKWLQTLLEWNRPLTSDIEGFGLKHFNAGIGTITFCWSKHEGIAFPVDLGNDPATAGVIRAMLLEFFRRFKNTITWHKADYDVTVLIYQLFMSDIIDTEGLLDGLEVMTRNYDDTRIIAYLATNSCAGNRLSLKDQAQEYSGKYALLVDDPDITKYPIEDVLRYNLIDGLSTWYVKEKHWERMVLDQQLPVYTDVFKPAQIDIIQMQLTGLPVNMETVKRNKAKLQIDFDNAHARIQASPLVQRFVYQLQEDHVAKRNAKLKNKRISLSDEETLAVQFNPNSSPQLQGLLFDMIQLPVIATTESKQAATDGDTLKALKNHTTDPDILALLDALCDLGAVKIIITTFVPALEGAVEGPDGWHYLFGGFNLGGTVSGRLSSSDPNLQNLPTGASDPTGLKAKYGKYIKECIEPPPGWVFVGLDFASLEDRISALTTKDPNKLKVYTDGYDGHSLRAYFYYSETMGDIDPGSVESINSIQKKHKPERQESKTPTFLLTYGGTYMGMMAQCGFSKEKAQMIEKRYHELYIVSDQWVATKLDEASQVGYVTVALGLRVRTPLLHQVIRGNRKTPFEAEAEGRTAGNALGQSWCLLNSRAWSEFMDKVRQSKHRLDIRPCAQIHDAGYALIRDGMEPLLFTNEHLVKAVEWQDHPDIAHDEVKLGGELSIFHPNWSQEIGIPNGATEEEILGTIETELSKRKPAA